MKEVTIQVCIAPQGKMPVARTLQVFYETDEARDELMADALKRVAQWARKRMTKPFTEKH